MAARTRRRRLALVVLLLLALVLLVEGGAWIAFLFLDGRAFTYSRLRQEQLDRSREDPLRSTFDALLGQEEQTTDVIHPYLGFVPEPKKGARAKNRSLVAPTHAIGECRMNEPRRAPDRVLVGIFGGSVAKIFSTEGAAPLIEELRKAPFVGDRKIELVVGSAGGWKQPQQLMALNWLLSIGGELDLLINLDGFNEVALHGAENARQGVFPACPRRWSRKVELVPDSGSRLALGRFSVAATDRKLWALGIAGSSLRWSVAVNLMWRARDRTLGETIERERRTLLEGAAPKRTFAVAGPEFGPPGDLAAIDELVAVWKRSSLVMDQICLQNDIRYFHFMQPNQYFEGSKPLSAQERAKAWNEKHPYRPGVVAGYPPLRAAGEELLRDGVRFVDLTQLFATVDETVYVDECCHFNALGNELLARAIGAAIVRDLGEKPPPE